MPPGEMSFKEKYLKLREKFDAVSGVHRQSSNELEAAQDIIKRLREENNHLLDLLADMMKQEGTEPMSDSETSSDNDEDNEMAHHPDEEAWRSQSSLVKEERHLTPHPAPVPDQSVPVNGC